MKNISYDSINRFLEYERFKLNDLFAEENKIEWSSGILSVDVHHLPLVINSVSLLKCPVRFILSQSNR